MAHHFDISDIQHEGWLVKKALSFGKDNWKKRYFRLQGQRLSYYEDSKTPLNKHKGVLIITADTRVREIPGGYHHGRMHELEVTFPKTKEVLYAVADDMDEMCVTLPPQPTDCSPHTSSLSLPPLSRAYMQTWPERMGGSLARSDRRPPTCAYS